MRLDQLLADTPPGAWRELPASRVEADICAALRGVGGRVATVYVTRTVRLLLVGFDECNYLLLVKAPGEALTRNEHRWLHIWRGCCEIVHNIQEALGAVEHSYNARVAQERDHDPCINPESPRSVALRK